MFCVNDALLTGNELCWIGITKNIFTIKGETTDKDDLVANDCTWIIKLKSGGWNYYVIAYTITKADKIKIF